MNKTHSTNAQRVSFYEAKDAKKVVEFIKESGATGGELVTEIDIQRFFESAEKQETERRTETDRLVEERDRLDSLAAATACAYPTCNGESHEHGLTPDQWSHYLIRETFDGSSVMLDSSVVGGEDQAVANISVSIDGDLNSVKLRAMADQYDDFPRFLRAHAERLDKLNFENRKRTHTPETGA
jgi:hypothetical protein